VSKRFVRVLESDTETFLWVPFEEGHKRVDFSSINKVTAEGDYMRVHTHGSSWLVHQTLREMLHLLGNTHFVLIHRSTILRCGFIERLTHRDRCWTAILDDGSRARVAKTRVASVLAKLRTNSSKAQPASST
jgi:two-component system response regulator AlgR